MVARSGAIFLLTLLLPGLLWAGRPFIGLEGGIFMPMGEWSNSLGSKMSLRLAIQQELLKLVSIGLAGGYQKFQGDEPNNFDLTMKMLLYLDAMAETTLNPQGNLFAAATAGPAYSSQEVTCGQGSESATVYGWSCGARISYQLSFVKRVYVRYRYVSLDMTSGNEITFGLSF